MERGKISCIKQHNDAGEKDEKETIWRRADSRNTQGIRSRDIHSRDMPEIRDQ
jgi:hypothetical protein